MNKTTYEIRLFSLSTRLFMDGIKEPVECEWCGDRASFKIQDGKGAK